MVNSLKGTKKSFIPFNGNFNITSSQSVEETAKQNLFYTQLTQIRMMMIFDAVEKCRLSKKKNSVGFMPIKKNFNCPYPL